MLINRTASAASSIMGESRKIRGVQGHIRNTQNLIRLLLGIHIYIHDVFTLRQTNI